MLKTMKATVQLLHEMKGRGGGGGGGLASIWAREHAAPHTLKRPHKVVVLYAQPWGAC